MANNFHKERFDQGTIVKLEIFRKYIREWISVFMTNTSTLREVKSINIFDFFSGPGYDGVGNPGSPVIIVEEIKNYCESNIVIKNNKPIKMHFNDSKPQKIEALEENFHEISCERDCCKAEFSNLPFDQSFNAKLPLLKNPETGNLVIMDQFGISDVTPNIVSELSGCSRTDILFFIPSAFIYRFREHPAFKNKIDMSDKKNIEYNTIHRHVCEYFKQHIKSKDYYLAPFSIKSQGQIHGVIFGSRHLYGLEKFLKICWSIDSKTGEANFSVDKDPSWSGQLYFIPEMNVIHKIDLFENDLKNFIDVEQPDNKEMYRFILTHGFTPTKAKNILEKLKKDKWLIVETILDDKGRKRKGFYLNHKEKRSLIKYKKNDKENENI